MDLPTFQALKYGNIITAVGTPKLMVTNTLHDSSGNNLWIACGGFAYGVADISSLTLISSVAARTKVEGATDGSMVLMGQTNSGAGWS